MKNVCGGLRCDLKINNFFTKSYALLKFLFQNLTCCKIFVLKSNTF